MNIELTRVFRQADPKFVALLNEIRHGLVTPDTARVLAQCSTQQLQVPAGIEPTRLYPLNRDVGMRDGSVSLTLVSDEFTICGH